MLPLYFNITVLTFDNSATLYAGCAGLDFLPLAVYNCVNGLKIRLEHMLGSFNRVTHPVTH